MKIVYSNSSVAVFYNRERIAYHIRNFKPLGFTTVHDHLPSSHQFVAAWHPDKVINWAGAIAPVVKDYITGVLKAATYPEQAYRSCVGILSFDKKYGRQRLIKAVERATRFDAYSYTIIKKILHNGLDQLLPDAEPPSLPPLSPHDNTRGLEFYK